jgi:hypothetical protein
MQYSRSLSTQVHHSQRHQSDDVGVLELYDPKNISLYSHTGACVEVGIRTIGVRGICM